MSLKMSSPWKHPKTGMFWVRRRVPAHLVSRVGRREEKFSLKTKDPVEAKRLFVQAVAEMERRWENLGIADRELTPAEASQLARPFYDGMLEEFRHQPRLQTRWDPDVGADCFSPRPEGSTFTLQPSERDLRRITMEGWCTAFAQERLAHVGMAQTEPNVGMLARSIAAALQAAALELLRLSKISVFAASDAAGSSAQVRVGPEAEKAPVEAKTIFEGWAGERKPAQKTLYTYEKVLAAFMDFVGTDDVTKITQKHVIDWKADMLAKGLTTKTIGASKLGALRAIFQWATDNSITAANPFAKVTISLKKKPGERRRGYSDEEAGKVLRAAEKETSAYRRWVPLLCAYTGARISEISQLRKEDLVEVQGITCLQFVPEAGSLKNASSERIIPLHPKVIEAGFLEFVKERKAGAIFAEVPPDRFGARGGNMTKLIARWVREEVGIVDPRVAPSHAWRHRFKTLCRRHGISADIGDALSGHSARTVADSYGSFETSALYRELCKLP
ncbi:integrase [Arsenicitalea aurantiaca]|uniref:Integrase n=1 Tax=Arsenicitalea aurantiaca TaxID=1783274 RepID=A0A433X7D2_9HYPH|nr:site-specific integrase [Arsenicitalea aurantiaca]RUT30001.1 integrase [Arsenicitalea aurantiaca]